VQTVVISATSLYVSGPLTVGREFIGALCASERFRAGGLQVIVFCHRRDLYPNVPDHPNLIWQEVPQVRRNWFVRLFYEYVWYRRWSRGRAVDLWISLQDTTPHVHAAHQVVYCHNPAIFHEGPADWRGDPRHEAFRLLYGAVYRTNLRRNDYAIVQQAWIRKEFAQRFGRPERQTIVAHPVKHRAPEWPPLQRRPPRTPLRMIYPAFPRTFKNCELLIEAMAMLRDLPVELVLTFSGDETPYARRIRASAAALPRVTFAGFLPHQELERLYASSDLLVFPSRLETWGLPLSEFQPYGKPIAASELPYAREVLGGYPYSVFFSPDSPAALASLVRQYYESGTLPYETPPRAVEPPFASDWDELIAMLLALIPPTRPAAP
jgi:glycosyltransferase involved in cell wall biosynthesis